MLLAAGGAPLVGALPEGRGAGDRPLQGGQRPPGCEQSVKLTRRRLFGGLGAQFGKQDSRARNLRIGGLGSSKSPGSYPFGMTPFGGRGTSQTHPNRDLRGLGASAAAPKHRFAAVIKAAFKNAAAEVHANTCIGYIGHFETARIGYTSRRTCPTIFFLTHSILGVGLTSYRKL